jgi:hypothetical protein
MILLIIYRYMVGDSFPKNHRNIKRIGSTRLASFSDEELDEKQITSMNILIEIDGKGIIKYISPIVSTVLGYDPSQICNTTAIPFLNRNYFLEATYSRKSNFDILLHCKKPDGTIVYCMAQGINNMEGSQAKGSTWVMKVHKDQLEMSSLDIESIPNIDLALCQVCERSIPAIMFSSHIDICLQIHEIEMGISLCRDELQNHKLSLIEKSNLLKEEYDLELEDSGDGRAYLKYLHYLDQTALKLAKFLEEIALLPIPKWDDGIDYAYADEVDYSKLELALPAESEFFPQNLPEGVNEAVLEIAGDIFSISIAISSILQRMASDLVSLKPKIPIYRAEAFNEDELKIKIGLQTQMDLDNSCDSLKDTSVSNESLRKKRTGLTLDPNFLKPDNGIADVPLDDRYKMRRGNRTPRMVLGGNKSIEITSPFSPTAFSPSAFSPSSPLSIDPRAIPSMKDYQIIKPISKGAFGSVFLAKKLITSEYYAIKVLKKSDMVSKNQVLNVKAERTILTQLDSPYVVKLFYTFQSQEHIYLVMEYLNGFLIS